MLDRGPANADVKDNSCQRLLLLTDLQNGGVSSGQ